MQTHSFYAFRFFPPCHGKQKLGILKKSVVVLVVKNLPAYAGDIRDKGLIPGSGRFPWRRACQLTPVFLPGESHGQRSLVGYSPSDLKELNMTEVT